MDKSEIDKFIADQIRDTDIFLVETRVKPGNQIVVYIDKPEGISISECVDLSRKFNNHFDREAEDYDLQVSSPGLDMDLKVEEQFQKYVNRDIQVIMNTGDKCKGELLGFDDNVLKVRVLKKVKPEGSKKKKVITEDEDILRSEIKAVKAVISFK